MICAVVVVTTRSTATGLDPRPPSPLPSPPPNTMNYFMVVTPEGAISFCTRSLRQSSDAPNPEAKTVTADEARKIIIAAPAVAQFISMGGMEFLAPALMAGAPPDEADLLWETLASNRHVDLSVVWAVNYGFPTTAESHLAADDADDLACLQRVHATALQRGYLERRTQSGSTQRLALSAGSELAKYAFHGVGTCARLAREHPPDQSWMTTPYDILSLFKRD